jgi:hypothetical protein
MYRTGEAIMDCYWQTLCAGVMPGGYDICQEEFRKHSTVMQTVRFFTNPLQRAPFLASVPWLKASAMVAAMAFHMAFRSFSECD